MPSKIPYSRRPPPKLKVNGTRAELYNRFKRDKDSAAFYASAAWHGVRDLYLCSQPYCEDHLEIGEYVVAVIVHHKLEIKTHPHLALDLTNLRSQCRACHNTEHKSKGNARMDAKPVHAPTGQNQ
jgi:5-methylcytosine-specific restriction enzyme A